MPRPLLPFLAVAAALLAVAPAAAVPSPADTPAERPAVDPLPTVTPSRWIFAAEDTVRIPGFYEMSEIDVRAERLKIGEIVQRCIEREEELRERIETHEYTLVAKTVLSIGGTGEDAERQMIIEQADRHYFRKPDEERTVPLKLEKYRLEHGERKEWELEDDENPAVQISYRDLNELPFYLADQREYDFEILSREIVGDRVIYEVRLAPKSDFAIAPSGRIWVDTSTFSILREEFDFGDRAPLPMFIERVGPFIRERERVGDLWVWKRMLIRVKLRAKYFRWLDRDIPDVVEFLLLFRDHRVNEGWSTDGKTVGAGEGE